jgi:hypothetical protein
LNACRAMIFSFFRLGLERRVIAKTVLLLHHSN